MLKKTRFASLGSNTAAYVNIGKGKVGIVHKKGNTTYHAGANPRSGPFVRGEQRITDRVKLYGYAKLHEVGAGATGRVTRHIGGKVAVNSTIGPYGEIRYKRYYLRRRF